jgi:hypothetical protein
MPTSTDLVTDLPADFEVFGQAVDTQMKTNADAATQKATLTTKGDIYAATGASTPARLAVGTNGQILTADSTAATGVAWATPSGAGWSSAATGSLTGASVTVSSLSGSRFYVTLDNASTTTAEAIILRLNGDSGTNYLQYKQVGTTGATGWELTFGNLTAASNYYGLAFFIDLANTAASHKPIGIGTPSAYFATSQVFYRSTSSITSMNFSLASGAFDAGTYTIWKQG